MMRALSMGKDGKVHAEEDPKAIAKLLRSKAHTTWLDFEEPTIDELHSLEHLFGFHPLTVEDVITGSQRPKIEDFGDYAYIVVRAPGSDYAHSDQLNMFLGANFLVTVDVKTIKRVSDAFDRVRRNPAALANGADYVAYTILDYIVDGFFPIVEEIDDELDEIEDKIFARGDSAILPKLFEIKKRVIAIRRVAMPMREIANALARRDFEFISARNSIYFRDVYDHLVRITETTDNFRDLITSSMEGHLSVVSNHLNVVMKKLASWTVIIMLPALITGFYGMNVVNLPLANHEYSPEIITGAIIAMAAILYLAFKRIDWV